MVYYNKEKNVYYLEGEILTWQTSDTSLFSGIPTRSQLLNWGFEEATIPQPTPREKRMEEILAELASMDYLTSKYIDGEDMTEYGDWQQQRRLLREEYRQLEADINTVGN